MSFNNYEWYWSQIRQYPIKHLNREESIGLITCYKKDFLVKVTFSTFALPCVATNTLFCSNLGLFSDIINC